MGVKPLKLAIFISGRGSNMQALVNACKGAGAPPDFPAEVTLVLSNRPDAGGLEFARKSNIATAVVDHKNHDGRERFEAAILDELSKHDVDVICLAGFMRLLTPYFLTRWAEEFGGQIINIHPSLLPLYKGTDTHARALADGAREAGCSVHFVIPEMDGGEVIVQRKVPVLEGDTPDTLSERVLAQEHIAYPQAIEKLAAMLAQ